MTLTCAAQKGTTAAGPHVKPLSPPCPRIPVAVPSTGNSCPSINNLGAGGVSAGPRPFTYIQATSPGTGKGFGMQQSGCDTKAYAMESPPRPAPIPTIPGEKGIRTTENGADDPVALVTTT